MIALVLLIGIVKKNAIMMIDFALVAQREHGLAPREAAREASIVRFRPIMMTTMVAILAAVPLAIGLGEGSELRRPLGIAMIGLLFSQSLTLLSTPALYVIFSCLAERWRAVARAGAKRSCSSARSGVGDHPRMAWIYGESRPLAGFLRMANLPPAAGTTVDANGGYGPWVRTVGPASRFDVP